jgi:hypothetical protein
LFQVVKETRDLNDVLFEAGRAALPDHPEVKHDPEV